MPDKKLTDTEIKKALECCAEQKCWECPNEPKENKKGTFGCSWEMMLATLDLINRYEEENKSLQAEIERLKAKANHYNYCYENFVNTPISRIKAEAYKEFEEQLDAEIESSDKYIREYDNSEVQKAYNKGLRDALKVLKELVGDGSDS